MFTTKTSLIIPTRNRSEKITFLIDKINKLKIPFLEIIIIDSSNSFHKKRVKQISGNNIKHFNSFPSTTHQRNIGLKKKNKKSSYVFFLDDDIEINQNAFHQMNKSLIKYKNNKEICSFAFNLISVKKRGFLDKLKKSHFFEKISLYSRKPGKVLKNGWQTRIENLSRDTYVDWIYSGATLYKTKYINRRKFKTLNKGYNYLEDLYFSFKLSKENLKHIVIAKAKLKDNNFIERNDYNFGIIEIINRYKFVKSFKLNKKLFYLSAIIRSIYLFSNLRQFKFLWFFKFLGNIYGLLICSITIYKKKLISNEYISN